jgi:AbrB family looped-hinge helix DNA binding protein
VQGFVQQMDDLVEWQKTKLKVFVGHETVEMDQRKRVRMPLNLVDGNERDVVVTTSLHGPYLEVWPKWRYEQFYANLFKKVSMSTSAGFNNYADKDFIDNLRDLVANHFRVTIDDSFRLTIPQELREEIGIDSGDEVVVVGQVEFTEIWPASLYKALKNMRTNRDSSRVLRTEGIGAGVNGGDAGSDTLQN